MKKKIINFCKNDYCLLIVLFLYLILSLLAIHELGINYNINSDDISYINSGINFAKNHTIIMHGVPSAQIMPGMSYIIGFLSIIFGSGQAFIISLKILWLIMGGCSIIYLYKTIRLFTSQWFAFIGSLFLLTPDYIWTNNVILTETPFILLIIMLIYYAFKLADSKKVYCYIMIIICFITCLFIRPNIGLYPLVLFLYLILKKYDLKLLFKQIIIAGIILFLALTHWIYRNYKVFERFIPLTYGMGNPLLLGTYQGVGFPLDEELDYENDVLAKAPEELQYYINNKNSSPKWRKFYSLEYDGLKAKYRMIKWWQKDKYSMLKSYIYGKLKIMLTDTFYWKEIFGVSSTTLKIIRVAELGIFIISCLAIWFNKKYRKELILLLGIYLYNLILYCYSFAYGRYAITLYPLRFIVIGLGLFIIYNYINKKRRGINEKN